jgi:Protein of unknown function (DUF2569)
MNDVEETTGKKQLVGVGGWLAFLVAVLFILGPILSLLLTLGEVSSTEKQYPEIVGNELWANIKLVIWATLASQIAISIFAGYRLNSRRVPATVPIVIACLWLMGPVLNFLAFLIVSSMNQQADASTNEIAVEIFRSVMTATGWTAYLLLSRRVKNTYRRGNHTE